ncbi:hypothetical protein HDU85_007442 [Gaertneriomyces sp. JEL0708]|nr:hypothetical protein HDU85_007442 [Gaertneriomyces sp. JEL0708]
MADESTAEPLLSSHPFCKYFMTGRYADALLKISTDTSDDFSVPVHRLLLASQSDIFDKLFSCPPISHEHLPSADPSGPGLVGAWSLMVPDDACLRPVLEWCYFARLSDNSLSPEDCWTVRETAKTLGVVKLVEYVDNWIMNNLAQGDVGKGLSEALWAKITTDALKADAAADVITALVSAAVGPPDGSAPDASVRHEVDKYRFLRRIVVRDDVKLTPEQVKKLFSISVAFTKFGISELTEAYEDPALPRDVIAEALMRALLSRDKPAQIQYDRTDARRDSGVSEIVACATKDHSESPASDTIPSEPTRLSTSEFIGSYSNDVDMERVDTQKQAPPPRRSSREHVPYVKSPLTVDCTNNESDSHDAEDGTPESDEPMSVTLAKIRQCSLDQFGWAKLLNAPALDDKVKAIRGDSTTSVSAFNHRRPVPKSYDSEVTLSVPVADGALRRQRSLSCPSFPPDLMSSTPGPAPAAEVRYYSDHSDNDQDHESDELDEPTITLENAHILGTRQPEYEPELDLKAEVPLAREDTVKAPPRPPVIEEEPSFSDEQPLAELREVRRQVQSLLIKQQKRSTGANRTMPIRLGPKTRSNERPSTPNVLEEVRRRLEEMAMTENTGGSSTGSQVSTPSGDLDPSDKAWQKVMDVIHHPPFNRQANGVSEGGAAPAGHALSQMFAAPPPPQPQPQPQPRRSSADGPPIPPKRTHRAEIVSLGCSPPGVNQLTVPPKTTAKNYPYDSDANHQKHHKHYNKFSTESCLKKTERPNVKHITFAEAPTFIAPTSEASTPSEYSSTEPSAQLSRSPQGPRPPPEDHRRSDIASWEASAEQQQWKGNQVTPATPALLLGLPSSLSSSTSALEVNENYPAAQMYGDGTHCDPRATWAGPPLATRGSNESTHTQQQQLFGERHSSLQPEDFAFLEVPGGGGNKSVALRGAVNGSFRMLGFKHVGESVAAIGRGAKKRKGIVDFFKGS